MPGFASPTSTGRVLQPVVLTEQELAHKTLDASARWQHVPHAMLLTPLPSISEGTEGYEGSG